MFNNGMVILSIILDAISKRLVTRAHSVLSITARPLVTNRLPIFLVQKISLKAALNKNWNLRRTVLTT